MRRLQPAAPPALGFHIVAMSGRVAWERAQVLPLEREQAWASQVRLRWRLLLLEPRSTSSQKGLGTEMSECAMAPGSHLHSAPPVPMPSWRIESAFLHFAPFGFFVS